MQQGFYNEPPSRRFAYDKDGTKLLFSAFGARPTIYGQSFVNQLNQDDESTAFSYGDRNSYGQIIFYFPERRNVTHYQLGVGSGAFGAGTPPGYIEVSNDTTNGVDGTWTQIASGYIGAGPPTQPGARNAQTTLAGANGVRAIRFSFTYVGVVSLAYINHIHLYGYFATGETPDRIDFTDSFGQPLIVDFDYGDQANNIVRTWSPDETWNQGSPLFLRNHSTSLTAEDIYIDFSANVDNMASYMKISSDNVTYGSFLSIPSLAPGQSYGPIWVKHDPNLETYLGVHNTRLQVDVGSWT